DTTVYDSVTLQLNLANGTFTILDATLRDTTFENAVVDSVTEGGLKIDFYGCALTGKNQVTCMTKIVALDSDMLIGAGNPFSSTALYDNLSNEYLASTATALNEAGSFIRFTLIQGIPVEVRFIFNNINSAATSISSFQPVFNGTDSGVVSPDFRDIDF
ncbi:MAG: hypothetical protein KDE66_06635, partial [Nitrosomonas sp.]|nr:hypothetical protein [Nitrosomonas sp.]